MKILWAREYSVINKGVYSITNHITVFTVFVIQLTYSKQATADLS